MVLYINGMVCSTIDRKFFNIFDKNNNNFANLLILTLENAHVKL
jgi:hypothetical protein